MTAHKHAALMAQYSADAWVSDKPWELWESRRCGEDEWNFLHVSPVWYDDFEYRRRPPMVTRTITYPEPCRKALEIDQKYWLTALYGTDWCRWGDCDSDHAWLKEGLVHLTKENAEAHRLALLGCGE